MDTSLHKSDDSCDPATRESFPRPACLQVKYRHGQLQLGARPAIRLFTDDPPEYFVGSTLLRRWFRIAEADYYMLLGRLKADRSCKVGIAEKAEEPSGCGGTLTFTFGKEAQLEVRHLAEDDHLGRRTGS